MDDDVYEYRTPGVRAIRWTGDNEAKVVMWLAKFGLKGFECDWRGQWAGGRDFIIDDSDDDDGCQVGDWITVPRISIVTAYHVKFMNDKEFHMTYTKVTR